MRYIVLEMWIKRFLSLLTKSGFLLRQLLTIGIRRPSEKGSRVVMSRDVSSMTSEST